MRPAVVPVARMSKLAPALAALAVTVAGGCGGRDEPERHEAPLRPVNGSEARGAATIAVTGDHLTVHVRARGLEPDRIHEQAVHGFVGLDDRPRCPGPGDDRDGSGTVEADEGERLYGEEVARLEPFPTVGSGGRLDYEHTFTVDTRRLKPLVQRVLVLRGGMLRDAGDERYVPTLPVACGRITAER